MEEKHASPSKFVHTESNGVSHGSDNGWQKGTYSKKPKKPDNSANNSNSRTNSNKVV